MELVKFSWIIFLVVPIGLFFISAHFKKKRCAELKELFLKLGFQFQEDSNYPSNTPIALLDLMHRGRNQKISNVARLKVGQNETVCCDFSYRTGSGKHSKTHFLSLLCIHGQFDLPEFTLCPEDMFSKIAQAVGYKDIDFDFDKDFSKMFVVRGKNPDQIKSILSPLVMQSLKRRPQARIEANKGAIAYYRNQVPTLEIQNWIEEGRRILQGFGV